MRKGKYKGKIKKAANGIQQVQPNLDGIQRNKGNDTMDAGVDAVGSAIPIVGAVTGIARGISSTIAPTREDGTIDEASAGVAGLFNGSANTGYLLGEGKYGDAAMSLINPFGAGKKVARMKNEKVAQAKAEATNKTFNSSVSGIDVTKHQTTQIMKKGGKTKYSTIEIEGKAAPEIVEKDGNIIAEGKTPHSQGGDKVTVPVGSTVYPTQNSPAQYAKVKDLIKRSKSGDLAAKKELTKIKQSLPEDTNSKAEGGIKTIKPDYQDGTGLNSRIHDEIMALNGGPKVAKPWDPQALNERVHAEIMARDTSTKPSGGAATTSNEGGKGIDANGVMQYGNLIYNTAKAFEKPHKEKRRYFNPVFEKYNRDTAATERAIQTNKNVSDAAARGLSAGNAGNMRANIQANSNKAVDQMAMVDTQEAARAADVQNRNINLRNAGNQTNLELDISYDEKDLLNKAATNKFGQAAANEASMIGYNNAQMKNQQKAEEQYMQILGNMYNYKFAENNTDIIFAGDRSGTVPPPPRIDVTKVQRDGDTTTRTRRRYNGMPGSRYTNGGNN